MNRKLILVESPTKAKHIKDFLPSNYTVLATRGFMFELMSAKKTPKAKKPLYGSYSIRTDDHSYDMLLDYAHAYGSSSKKHVDEIRKLITSGDYDTLYMSTDPDRAGENISYQLVNFLAKDIKKTGIMVKRATWHEITKKAVINGLKNAGSIDVPMAQADEARAIYDRLFGYSISPYLWRVVARGTSGGRAQSPALRLVVDREKKRMAFVSKDYGSIDGKFNINNRTIIARLKTFSNKKVATGSDFNADGEIDKNKLILTKDNLKTVSATLKKNQYHVDDVTTRPYSRRPSAPYTTSTFQQDVGTRLGLSSKQLMGIAQKLFENSFITYHRTDSTILSVDGLKAARHAAISRYGKTAVPASPRQYAPKSKNAQEGHEALRPATLDNGLFADPDSIRTQLDKVDRKAYDVYKCVWNRTVASQMLDAKGITTTISIANSPVDTVFTATGTVISEPGWMQLTRPVSTDDEQEMPSVSKNDSASLKALKSSMHSTEPPARFTEPQLVAELERLGIGRPSTYASIVSVNQERGYVKKMSKALYPTPRGFQVAQILESEAASFVDYSYTAKMESELDTIENGKRPRNEFLDEVWYGDDGIKKNIVSLSNNIDWDKINGLSRMSLGDGIVIKMSNTGVWAEDTSCKPDEKGYYPSIKLDDDVVISELNPEDLREQIRNKPAKQEPENLGVIETGPYKGWVMTVRVGRYGKYVQAEGPKGEKANAPVKADEITREDALALFGTMRTRQIGDGYFTGIGKRGPWLGHKNGSRGRAVFMPLPDGVSQMTMTVSDAKKIWDTRAKK